MYHPDDVEDDLSPYPDVVVDVVVEYPSRQGGVLNYCNFEVYSLIIPDVPIGRIICISLYPDDPIGRTTKSHEEIPSIVSRFISTIVNIILSCLCPREVGPVSFSGADLLSGKSSERKNINISEALLISTLTLTCVAHKREREVVVAARRRRISLGFYLLSFDHLY